MKAGELPLVIGVDAGGTSLRVRVVQGEKTRGYATGAADPEGGPEPLGYIVQGALAEAGAGYEEVRAICAGITKVSRPGVRAGWEAALARFFAHLPDTTRRVEPDFVTAFHGAVPNGIGIAVIAGTGSVVYGEDGTGQGTRVGGRGWEFGDEGSGAFLTTEAVRRALRALDGLEKPSPLTAIVVQELGTDEPAVLAQVARERAVAEGRGFLVPLLLDRARTGDREARDLFVGAAGWLAAYVRATHGRLQLEAPVTVATIGGIWEAGELITEPFATVLRRWVSEIRVVTPDSDPAMGAARLAARSLAPYTEAANVRKQ